MKLPLIVVTFLPKKWQDKYIQKQWDNKTDESILTALADANEWIELSKGIMSGIVIEEIAKDCQDRLDKFIIPQVTKRGL